MESAEGVAAAVLLLQAFVAEAVWVPSRGVRVGHTTVAVAKSEAVGESVDFPVANSDAVVAAVAVPTPVPPAVPLPVKEPVEHALA